jgi:DNA-binding helix-turn-helix protein
LARQMGVSRVYVGDLLKGRRQTPERINQIEEILKDVLEDE